MCVDDFMQSDSNVHSCPVLLSTFSLFARLFKESQCLASFNFFPFAFCFRPVCCGDSHECFSIRECA